MAPSGAFLPIFMAIPLSPSSFFVQQANNTVLASWGLVAGATSYKLQRSSDGVTYTDLATVVALSFLDTTVTSGSQYYYQVASLSGAFMSPYTQPQAIAPVGAGQMTLGQIRLLSQQKADMVNSQFVTMPEWNVYINQSYFELYDILIQAYGNEYYVAPPLQFTTTSAQFYDLPDGTNYNNAPPFYKLLGLDLGLNPGNNAFITLKKFNFISRNRYVFPQILTNALGVAGLKYRLMGSQVEFIPTPSSGQIVQAWYIPRLVALLQDTDIADGVSGWTEYIAVDAAIKALQKQEDDVSILMAQKAALLVRIQAAAENRDAGEPDTISDTRRYTDLYGTGYGYGDTPTGGF